MLTGAGARRLRYALRFTAGALLVVAAVGTAEIALERMLLDAEIAEARGALDEEARQLSVGLRRQIGNSELALRGMSGALAVTPDMTEERYHRLARNLTSQRGAVRNVAAAPGLVVRYIYPVKGNEAVLGLDYRNRPDQFRAVLDAMQTHEIATSDPVELVQGGTGLILHDAIFVLDDEMQTTGRFWGVTSVVLDFSDLLALSGLSRVDADNDVAIRSFDPRNAEGGAIYGDQAVFRRQPVLDTVSLSQSAWEVGLVPKAGWPVVARSAPGLRFCALLLTLALLAGLWQLMRLRAERNASRERLESAVEVLDDGFALFDSEGRLVMCNSRYRELYEVRPGLLIPGVARQEVARANVFQGRMAEAVGHEESWLEAWRARLPQVRWDSEHQLDDGRWIKLSDSRTHDGGTVCVRVDITALKEARDAAEAANEAKTNFLNTVSHELRTPLTVILGFNAFLRAPESLPEHRDLSSALTDPGRSGTERLARLNALSGRIAKITAQIDNSGNLLLSLINSVLDWSKIEEGALRLETGELDADALLDKVVQLLQPLASRKGLRLRTEPEGGTIVGDDMRLEQVLINLTANAVKFSEHGEILLGCERRDGEVRFRVEDSGCGIAEEDLGLIFERFRQIDGSQSRAHPGSGLGLAIARTIVELHGGRIWAESAPGVGSRFYFTVPLGQEALRAAE